MGTNQPIEPIEFTEEAETLRACFNPLFNHCPGVFDESGYLTREFVPTRYELEVLATHYAQEQSGILAWELKTGGTGSSPMRFASFAAMRLSRIAGVLGEERLAFILRGQDAWNRVFFAGAEELCQRRGVACLADLTADIVAAPDPEVEALHRGADRAKVQALREEGPRAP